MKHITITVPDNKLSFTVELFNNLKFVKKVTTNEDTDRIPTKKEFNKNFRSVVREVNLIVAGKKKGTPLKEFLDEL